MCDNDQLEIDMLPRRTKHPQQVKVLHPGYQVGVGSQAAADHGQHVGRHQPRTGVLIPRQHGQQDPRLLPVHGYC